MPGFLPPGALQWALCILYSGGLPAPRAALPSSSMRQEPRLPGVLSPPEEAGTLPQGPVPAPTAEPTSVPCAPGAARPLPPLGKRGPPSTVVSVLAGT